MPSNRQGANARRNHTAMDAGVFAAPKTYMKKGQRDSRTQQILDALNLGAVNVFDIHGDKPIKAKNLASKKLKSGLHSFNGPYSSHDVITYMRKDDNFAKTILMLGLADLAYYGGTFGGTWKQARQELQITPDKRSDGNGVITIAYTVLVNPKQGKPQAGDLNQARDKVREVVGSIIDTANEIKMNPLDVVTLAGEGVGANAGTPRTKAPANSWLTNVTRYKESLEAAKAAIKKFSRSKIRLLQEASNFLHKAAEGASIAFAKGLKAWPAPARRASNKGGKQTTNVVYMVEVLDFTYDIEGSGKSLKHVTAARQAERKLNTPEELAYALQNYTPAGRIYLCYSPQTKSMFLASQRKPSKPVYVNGKRIDSVAALYGATAPSDLWGFIL